MLFNLLFILIWLAIVILAKDRIKSKIKSFFKKPNTNSPPSTLFTNIQNEYDNIKTTLSLNVLSIKDELTFNNKKIQKSKIIKEDIVEYKDDLNTDDDEMDKIDMYETFQKAMGILKMLFCDMIKRFKKYLISLLS